MTSRCGARKRQGEGTCHLVAGAGTDHKGFGRCRYHGGNTTTQRTAAAREAGAALAAELQVDPHEALERTVWAWNGIVAYFTNQVAALEAEAVVITHRRERNVTDGEGDSYVETSTEARLNILVRERHEALQQLARAAKVAIDAGVQERHLQVVERLAAGLAEFVQGLLADFGLENDPRAPEIVRRRLQLLEGGKAA